MVHNNVHNSVDAPQSTYSFANMITSTLVKAIFAALVILRIFYAILASVLSPLRKVPGPFAACFTKLWYFTRVAKGNFHHENTDLHRRYGPLVRVAPNSVSLDDPSAIRTIYGIGSKFPKSDWYQAFKAPDPNLFTLFSDQDIKRHADSRKLVQNVYSMSSMVSYEAFVDQCADIFALRLGEAAENRRNLDMAHWFQAYAFDVVASVTFGSRFGFLERGQDIRGMMGELHEVMRYSSLAGIFPRLHAWIFFPSAKLGLFGSRGRVAHMEFVRRRMAMRAEERRLRDYEADLKAQANGTRDFMDRLWDKHDQDPERVTQHHIFMVGLANITAGSDTTSTTLSGILYYLLTHSRVLSKLKSEIEEFTADGQLSVRPTFKEAQQMPYLNAVIRESLRLHSAVGLPLWRVVPDGGVEVAGHFIPAGTNVGVNPWVAHRNQEVWGADAEDFRPERWLEAQAEAGAGRKERLQRMEAYHVSFGLGSRTCIGRHISILEMTKLVPRLLRDFEFELVRPEDGMKCDDIFFVLPRNLWVSVKEKEGSGAVEKCV